jgi:hypothetical protein
MPTLTSKICKSVTTDIHLSELSLYKYIYYCGQRTPESSQTQTRGGITISVS